MEQKNLLENAHLYLGISKQEVERRLSTGQMDLQLLESQLEMHCKEMLLEVISERLIENKDLAQVDKFLTE